MHSPAELRAGLVELAEPVTPTEGYEHRVLRRARRIRGRRRFASGTAAAVCLAVLVTMFRVLGIGSAAHLAAVPADGPFLGWPPVGDVDTGLVREATSVWGRAGPHTGIRTLVATRNMHLRSVVVLQGYDEQGTARLAFFTSDQSASDALRLRADRPAPDPVKTQAISLVSPRLTGATGEVSTDGWGTYVLAIAMPGVTTVRASSAAIDVEMVGEPDAPTSRLIVYSIPLQGTAETTTITGFVRPDRPLARTTKVFEVAGEGGAVGDARAVPAEVTSRTGQHLVVTFAEGGAVRPGQFAVVTEGLVGRVAAVDETRSEATIDLITSPAFSGEVYTNISDVPGSVRGTGEKLVMENVPVEGEIYQGNRVLMPDPSQRSRQIGAVTIGRATTDKAADADTVELTPTADLARLEKVSIMTPSAGR
ncbi:hypothetical protein AMIS_1350 [Actinoplanes missouriensis 431]|uniref:Rod shape-determining protein MreC beta-barrel core domain-containing protein n=1 Tax=Actinoplanes missouriensis (strain ATCC 14538 / DSM 43046 / CBS 188.64 / JCM 3121 / NBRC 102363 / NCIMB 12654 / NRRL B-3342 / UNCC 431) TaxID=512565 RepID=I0GX68_ACTM4|nr:rod shape-determining protein MreC [Actinoplanes missouriensis]BAL85355.1 hypothetical protein AMIS_1350 [Actinoplanes missouriensis 431]